MFNFEGKSPEEVKKEEDSREKYQKEIENKVKQFDGKFTKEEFIQNDAHVEDKARELLGLGQMSEKEFEALVNNSLTLKTDYMKYDNYYPNEVQTAKIIYIKGQVAGQTVELERSAEVAGVGASYRGSINGKKLDVSQAYALFYDLYEIIGKREEGIEGLKEERINQDNKKHEAEVERYRKEQEEKERNKKERKEREEREDKAREEKRKKDTDSDLNKIF